MRQRLGSKQPELNWCWWVSVPLTYSQRNVVKWWENDGRSRPQPSHPQTFAFVLVLIQWLLCMHQNELLNVCFCFTSICRSKFCYWPGDAFNMPPSSAYRYEALQAAGCYLFSEWNGMIFIDSALHVLWLKTFLESLTTAHNWLKVFWLDELLLRFPHARRIREQ